jgi:hypothetical protein
MASASKWELHSPEEGIHKVAWNSNENHEFEVATAGYMGFVRLENVPTS